MRRLVLAATGAVAVVVAPIVLMSAPGSGPPPFSGLSAAQGSVCTAPPPLAPYAGVWARSEPVPADVVAKAAYAAGWRGADLVVAVAVAMAESGHVPDASNTNTNGSVDYGLWQVNSVHGAVLAQGDWRDPTANAAMAYSVWTDAGASFAPWVTFWRGTYRQHVDAAQAVVAGLGAAVEGLGGCTADVVVGGSLADPGAGPQGADGMTPRAANVRALTRTHWGCAESQPQPCISSIGGYARRNIAGTGTVSDHATGNAVDIMLGSGYRSKAALGWEIARFWQANAARAGIKYVIFDARIWSASRAAEGWRPYAHPGGGGGDTLLHIDHVHVSVGA